MVGVSGWMAFAAAARDFGSFLPDGGGLCDFESSRTSMDDLPVQGKKNGGHLPPISIRIETI